VEDWLPLEVRGSSKLEDEEIVRTVKMVNLQIMPETTPGGRALKFVRP
jgi:hypothetical protein